jgi:uncharacterized membrane protein YebE (DUF533 family)
MTNIKLEAYREGFFKSATDHGLSAGQALDVYMVAEKTAGSMFSKPLDINPNTTKLLGTPEIGAHLLRNATHLTQTQKDQIIKLYGTMQNMPKGEALESLTPLGIGGAGGAALGYGAASLLEDENADEETKTRNKMLASAGGAGAGALGGAVYNLYGQNRFMNDLLAQIKPSITDARDQAALGTIFNSPDQAAQNMLLGQIVEQLRLGAGGTAPSAAPSTAPSTATSDHGFGQSHRAY